MSYSSLNTLANSLYSSAFFLQYRENKIHTQSNIKRIMSILYLLNIHKSLILFIFTFINVSPTTFGTLINSPIINNIIESLNVIVAFVTFHFAYKIHIFHSLFNRLQRLQKLFIFFIVRCYFNNA